MTDESESEFGRGVVVCLAKFSEHLMDRHAMRIGYVQRWRGMDAGQRDRERAEAARFPTGDAAERLKVAARSLDYDDPVSEAIERWANAASDHFYVIDDLAPGPLRELADLTLRMGHGFRLDGSPPWTWEDWQRVRALWRDACIAVDRQLGVAEPDWGSW